MNQWNNQSIIIFNLQRLPKMETSLFLSQNLYEVTKIQLIIKHQISIINVIVKENVSGIPLHFMTYINNKYHCTNAPSHTHTLVYLKFLQKHYIFCSVVSVHLLLPITCCTSPDVNWMSGLLTLFEAGGGCSTCHKSP